MEEENTIVKSVRINSREILSQTRNTERQRLRDAVRCGLANKTNRKVTSTDEILELCEQLCLRMHDKKKNLLLVRLSRAMLDSEANITTFLNHAALKIVVKELEGAHRLLAAELLCNSSLGDDKCCIILEKAAGDCLLRYSTEPDSTFILAQTHLWTIYNLIMGSDHVFLSDSLAKSMIQIVSQRPGLLADEAARILCVIIEKDGNRLELVYYCLSVKRRRLMNLVVIFQAR